MAEANSSETVSVRTGGILSPRSVLLTVPRSWWRFRADDRGLFALITVLFWGFTIYQAARVATHGASVFSLFGLGGVYLVFTIANVFSSVKVATIQSRTGEVPVAKARSQFQTLLILAGPMLAGNVAVLVMYYIKGATFTPVDQMTVGIDVALMAVLFIVYRRPKEFLINPITRAWVAIAGKTVPQMVTAAVFIWHPAAAQGISPATLAGIIALSALRFWPGWKLWTRNNDREHWWQLWRINGEREHFGVVLGEGGNLASGLLLAATWAIAVFLR